MPVAGRVKLKWSLPRKRKLKKIYHGSFVDLSKIPALRFDEFFTNNAKSSFVNVSFTTRGCPNKCEFCKSNDINTHFSLALYGWKEDDEYILHPENVLEIFSDNLLPKYYWKERE